MCNENCLVWVFSCWSFLAESLVFLPLVTSSSSRLIASTQPSWSVLRGEVLWTACLPSNICFRDTVDASDSTTLVCLSIFGTSSFACLTQVLRIRQNFVLNRRLTSRMFSMPPSYFSAVLLSLLFFKCSLIFVTPTAKYDELQKPL